MQLSHRTRGEEEEDDDDEEEKEVTAEQTRSRSRTSTNNLSGSVISLRSLYSCIETTTARSIRKTWKTSWTTTLKTESSEPTATTTIRRIRPRYKSPKVRRLVETRFTSNTA